MALGNIFEEELDKCVKMVDSYMGSVYNSMNKLADCGGLSMNEARQAAQCLADI